MSVAYRAVNWNRQKRRYDAVVVGGSLLFLAAFVAVSLARPDATVETALIRGLGALAFTLLHVILCIGPLTRLDTRFLPLLYNRRHLGVTMALIGVAHATFATLQYHGGGSVSPLVSLLTEAPATGYPAPFPFELLAVPALVVLLLMAATSHDFWLSVLTPPVWKALHMGVYLAYALLVMHVALGILQAEPTTAGRLLLVGGVALVAGLHLAAGWRERRRDAAAPAPADGWVDVCALEELVEDRGRAVVIGGERVAVFRHVGGVSALSGICRHQNGPLAEGRIIDGCVTCPWHGYQYYPDSGRSPPPFDDRLETYRVRIRAGRVEVASSPHAPGTRLEPARIP